MKNRNIEQWDYVVSGKQYGITKIVIIGVLAIFFAALTIDQLKPIPNKMPILAIPFGCMWAILTVTLIRLINRYFCYKICIGQNGFFLSSNPFNGKYYRYEDIIGGSQELKKTRHSIGYGDTVTYNYYFFFTDKNRKTRRILFEKSLYEKEFNILCERINSAESLNLN